MGRRTKREIFESGLHPKSRGKGSVFKIYAMGRLERYGVLLSKPEKEEQRSLSIFRFEFGFGFESLYHPYVEAIKLENERQAVVLLEEFQSRMAEFLHQLPVAERLNVQGWKLEDALIKNACEEYAGHGHFHSHLPKWGGLHAGARSKAAHLYSIKDSIKKFGYVPGIKKFGRGVKGPQLDGKQMIVLAGQHRAAVLAGLGWTRIPARFGSHGPNLPRDIQLKSLEQLPLVQRGVMEREVAAKVLSRIKNGFSKEKAHALGFPFA